MLRLSFLVVMFVAASSLHGCGGSTVRSYDIAPTPVGGTAPEHGLVVFEVIAMGSKDRSERGKWLGLEVVASQAESADGEKPKPVRIMPVLRSGEDAAYFAGELPPGEYTVQKLPRHGSLSLLGVNRSEMRDEVAAFTVEAGKVTDLGLVIQFPSGLGHAMDRFQPAVTATEVLQRAGLLAGHLPVNETEPPLDAARQLATSANLENSAIAGEAVSHDGSLFLPAQLGRIYKRSAVGEWSVQQTGTAQTIMKILPVSDELIALASTGELFLKRGNDDFKALDVQLPSGLLSDIVHDGARFIAASREWRRGEDDRLTVRLYEAHTLQGEWRETFNATFDGLADTATILLEDGSLLIKASSRHKRGYWHVAPGASQATSTNTSSLAQVKDMGDGLVGALTDAKALSWSHDGGASWQYGMRTPQSLPVRGPSGSVYLVLGDAPLGGSPFSVSRVHECNADGNGCSEVSGLVPSRCEVRSRLAYLGDGELLYLCGNRAFRFQPATGNWSREGMAVK